MSYHTMTIEEMLNNPLTPIFPKDYPFYCDDTQIKKEFEEKFIQANFLREIGFETPYAFQQQFKAKMMVLMPYYQQLYKHRNMSLFLKERLPYIALLLLYST